MYGKGSSVFMERVVLICMMSKVRGVAGEIVESSGYRI